MSDVDWVLLARDAVKVGDLVSCDAGGMPIYRVVAIDGGRAWLQGERDAAPRPMPLDRFCWKVAAAAQKNSCSAAEVACQLPV
jgi:hypothetical protein